MTLYGDAPESNAGDDFHLLWAARRSLELLRPHTDLKGIRPEGPAPSDSDELDPDGDKLLGIDLAEYYGSTLFQQSTKVVYSQLKYSTRRSDLEWTAARLTKGKDASRRGSVIDRLAEVFKVHSVTYGHDAVITKLALHVVSNRPCATVVAEAIAAAKSAIVSTTDSVPLPSLLGRLARPYADCLTSLKAGAFRLTPDEFLGFIRVLDVSFCGQASRLDQYTSLVRELGTLGFADAHSQYFELKTLMHMRMMPEHRHSSVITADDLIPTLGVPRLDDLFPAPHSLEPLSETIEREAVSILADSIITSSSQHICLHGGAGIGKTTVARSLKQHLPPGSIVVLFDCYAGGTYLDPAESRHSHARAIMQICNELASQAGSALLLNRRLAQEDFLRELIRRLRFAATIVRQSAPSALVVLIIDASDNSVAAAAARGERSFVIDLTRCRFPEGCKLILTARTHRIKDLSLPSDTLTLDIPPFTEEESARHLNRSVRMCTPIQAKDFHRLTGGIPRVQRYALSQALGDVDVALDLLRPGGQTVATIVNSQLAAADSRLGIPGFAETVCSALLILPRPIPLDYVAILTSFDHGAIRDFCNEVCSGLILESDLIHFRDEDFEAHLRDSYPPSPELVAKLLAAFRSRSRHEPYAAAHLADILHSAGCANEVIELLTHEREPSIISDPIARKDTFARRARYALHAAVAKADREAYLHILFIVAGAAKTDRSVETLLLENADIACRYGNPVAVQTLYLNENNERIGWYGPTHLLCAAHFARNPGTVYLAQSHLRAARAWLSWWVGLSEEERRTKPLHCDDIAYGAEALLRVNDLDMMSEWLERWQPRASIFESVKLLIRNLLSHDGITACDYLDASATRADILLLGIEACRNVSLEAPRPWIERALAVWTRAAQRRIQRAPSLSSAGIALAEVAASQGIAVNALPELVRYFANPPPHFPSYTSAEDAQPLDAFLRGQVLLAQLEGRELKSDDARLLPSHLQKKPPNAEREESQRWDDDRRKYHEVLSIQLPAYRFHAVARFRHLDTNNCREQCLGILRGGERLYANRRDYEHQRFMRVRAKLLGDAIVTAAQPDADAFRAIVAVCTTDCTLDTVLDLADVAAWHDALHIEAIGAIDHVARELDSRSMPGSEQVELFLRCCRIAGRVDASLGRLYFERSVNAASELDTEAFALLRAVAALSRRAADDDPTVDRPDLASTIARFTEDCSWRFKGWDHFPWAECQEAITCLSPAYSGGLLCRWDQRGVMPIQQAIPAFVAAAYSRGSIRPSTAIAWLLLPSLGNSEGLGTALTAILTLRADCPAATVDAGLSLMADYVTRIAPLEAREWLITELCKWSSANGLDSHPALQRVREVATRVFAQQVNTAKYGNDVTGISLAASSVGTDVPGLTSVSSSANPLIAEDIEHSLLQLKQDRHRHLGSAQGEILQFMRGLRGRIAPHEYVSHLTAVMRLSFKALDLHELRGVLEEACAAWDIHPGVREWKKHLPRLLATRRCQEFFEYDTFSHYGIQQLEEKLGVPYNDILDEVLIALPDCVRQLSAESLYDLARYTVATLDDGSAIHLIERLSPDLVQRTSGAECVAPEHVLGGVSSGSALEAGILWFLFGHPDKRVRWHAIHSANAMIRLGDTAIVSALARWLKERDHAFCIPGKRFYWLAARQWLFLLADHLSLHCPDALVPIEGDIIHEALSAEEPHALILLLAQRTALRLARHTRTQITATQVYRLENLFVSPFPSGTENEADHTSAHLNDRDYRSARNDDFDFNSMDTLPYWYEGVGYLFGVTGKHFCRMASHWIRGKWGFPAHVNDGDPVRDWHHYEYELLSNRQGEEPTVEDIHTYLEFNAMFCVAMELLRQRPLVRSRWDTPSFTSWLDRYDVSRPGNWLSDFRQQPPANTRYWTEPPRTALAEIPSCEEFEHVVGLDAMTSDSFLMVWGGDTIYDYDGYRETGVVSALVSEESSRALLRTLCGCRLPSDYCIPSEGDRLELREVSSGVRFVLRGWIEDTHNDVSGFDEHDPLRYSIGASAISVGSRLLRMRRRRSKSAEQRECVDPLVQSAFIEHWNDLRPGRFDRGFRTSGHRLWVRSQEILSLLQDGRWAMLFKVRISWSQRNSDMSKERKYDERVQLYLVHSNGTVESAAGSSRLGEQDS